MNYDKCENYGKCKNIALVKISVAYSSSLFSKMIFKKHTFGNKDILLLPILSEGMK